MTERLREPSDVFFRLPALILLVTDRQLPERVEHKALLLILAGYCILRAKVERIFGLLIEVGSIVESFRESVARRKRQLIAHPPVERE